MCGFKEFKDQAKINVVPDRIKVVTVKKAGTLAQVLSRWGSVNPAQGIERCQWDGVTDHVQAGA